MIMDHKRILTRAWTLLWKSRALWLFGFLFALAGGGGTNFPGGSNSGRSGGQPPTSGGLYPSAPSPDVFFNSLDWRMIATIGIAVLLVLVILAIVAVAIRYMAETALIAGVAEIETTGEKLTVRRGFRLGWSRQAWRLFLTDLAVYLPLTVGGLLLIAIAALPLLLWMTPMVPLNILASIFSVGLELLIILGLIGLTLALSVIMPFSRRRVVLEKMGVRAALRQGLALVRASLVDTGLLWLLLAGIRIGWSLVMIPIVILLVIAAALIGGVPAGLAYLATQNWIWPAAIGGSLFLLVLIPAAAFVVGLFEAYTSTSWTLAYRDVSSRSLLPQAEPTV
jgi:hypothetical protein